MRLYLLAVSSAEEPAKLPRLIVDLIEPQDWTALEYGCEGRRLRGDASEERRGYREWRGAVCHVEAAEHMRLDGLIDCDQVGLDLFWPRKESLERADALHAREVLAVGMLEHLHWRCWSCSPPV